MTITKEKKQQVISEYRRGGNDVGSPEVQIAILTSRINSLTSHLSKNKKDHATRRGLLGMVSRRRGLLDYLRRLDPDKYLEMLKRLNIRK